jgi:hypothetical protein
MGDLHAADGLNERREDEREVVLVGVAVTDEEHPDRIVPRLPGFTRLGQACGVRECDE